MFPFPFSFIAPAADIPVDQIANAEAMSFNGTDAYIDTGNIDITGTKTISFWINAPSGDNGGIFTMGSASSTERISIALWGSNINAMFNATNKNRANFTIVDNTWYHVVIVKSTNSIDHIYINGVSQTIDNTTSWSGPVPVASFIGVYSSLYFEGKLDEFAIFNTALSSEKITQIYDATAVVGGVPQTANLFTGGLDTSLVYWNRMGDS